MQAFVQVQGIPAAFPHDFAAGIVSGPRAFSRAVHHATQAGFTLVGVSRVRNHDTRRCFALAVLTHDNAPTRRISVELHDWTPQESAEVIELYARMSRPVAPFLA